MPDFENHYVGMKLLYENFKCFKLLSIPYYQIRLKFIGRIDAHSSADCQHGRLSGLISNFWTLGGKSKVYVWFTKDAKQSTYQQW